MKYSKSIVCLAGLVLLLCGCAAPAPQRVADSLPLRHFPEPRQQSAQPQGPPAVCDENIRDILLNNSPELQTLRKKVLSAEFTVQQAGVYPNPSLSLKADEISLDDPGFDKGKRSVGVAQLFELGGKRQARVDLAQAQKTVAEQTYQARLAELVRDARASFYNILLLRATEELSARLVELEKKRLSLVQELRDKGAASETELLNAKVAFSELEVKLGEVHTAHQNQLSELKRLLGLPQEAQAEIAGELKFPPEVGFDASHGEQSQFEHPAMQLSLEEVKAADSRIALEETGPIPDLHFELMYTYKEEADDEMGGIGLGFTLPLFDRRKGAIESAKADADAARAKVNYVKTELSAAHSKAQQSYDAALQFARTYHNTVLPAKQAALKLIEAAYRAGRVSSMDMLEAQGSLVKTEMESLQRVAELYEALVELEYFWASK